MVLVQGNRFVQTPFPRTQPQRCQRFLQGKRIELFTCKYVFNLCLGINIFSIKHIFFEFVVEFRPISYVSCTVLNLQIPQSEKAEIKENLYNCSPGLSAVAVETQDFYKVHFTEVLDLVRSRRAYLSRGYAFIPSSDLVSVLIGIFRANLSQALVVSRFRLVFFFLPPQTSTSPSSRFRFFFCVHF